MTKIINLDQLATKRDKVVVLGGVEHVMTTLTVKDYIHQMKASANIAELAKDEDDAINSAEKIMNLTIEALMKLSPTITREQFEAMNMDQLNAIRELAEDYVQDDAPEPEAGE